MASVDHLEDAVPVDIKRTVWFAPKRQKGLRVSWSQIVVAPVGCTGPPLGVLCMVAL
jgi:hypothetical protein